MKKMKNEKGQGLLEYVILVALVGMVCVGSSKLLGKKINAKIKDIKEHIDTGIPVDLTDTSSNG
jgi:Flp pilus assembly pilin Flp